MGMAQANFRLTIYNLLILLSSSLATDRILQNFRKYARYSEDRKAPIWGLSFYSDCLSTVYFRAIFNWFLAAL